MQDEVINRGSLLKNKPDSSISSGKEKSAASQLIDRYFRQVAKQYAERIKPLESTLQTYQEVREVQSVVTAALVQLAADIRNHPTALREAVSFRREMRKIKAPGLSQSLEGSEHANAYPELVRLYDVSPFKPYLEQKKMDSNWVSELKNLMINAATTIAQSEEMASRINGDVPAKKLLSETDLAGQFGTISFDFSKGFEKLVNRIVANMLGDEKMGGGANVNVRIASVLAQLEAVTTPELKVISLVNWVTKTARLVHQEGLKIFDTPEVQMFMQRLDDVAAIKNGLGGAILYGPPGTGKTELLVHWLKSRGLNSRVISISAATDYSQLMGERKISIGMDTTSSLVQRIDLILDNVNTMNGQEKKAILTSILSNGQDAWKEFIQRIGIFQSGREISTLLSTTKLTDDVVDLVFSLIKQKLQKDLVTISVGLSEGLDETTAFVRGEILQAFNQGCVPILDEMDKGNATSLDGISRLLNVSPGSELSIGGETVQVPPWGMIYGTANSLDLAPHLRDRFAPNVEYLGYSSPQEMMQRSLVWLSDENGQLLIDHETQSKLVILFSLVFPQIQALYPTKIEQPLSNRGIRKFCLMLAQGRDLMGALSKLLLDDGSLTTSSAGKLEIVAIISKFNIVSSVDSVMPTQSSKQSKSDALISPFYRAVLNYYEPHPVARDVTIAVNAPNDLKAHLSHERSVQDKKYRLKIGAEIQLVHSARDGKLMADYAIDGMVATSYLVKESFNYANLHIAATTNDGGSIVIHDNEKWIVIDLLRGTEQRIEEEAIRSVAFLDEKSIVIHAGNRLIIRTDVQSSGSKNIALNSTIEFFDEISQPLSCSRVQLSDDRSYLLVEASSGETYLIQMRQIIQKKGAVQLSKPFSRETGWSLTHANILLNPNQETAVVLKR